MDVNYDKNSLKSVLYYLKDNYGIQCFKDRRFLWMLANLMPDNQQYLELRSIDYNGLLMKITNSISSKLETKIKLIEEAREYNKILHLRDNGKQLTILTDVIGYFDNNNCKNEELKEYDLKPIFDKLLNKLKSDDLEFAYCPAGSYMMGSPINEKGRENNENQYKVTLSKGFYIAKKLTSCNLMNKYGIKGYYGIWKANDLPAQNANKKNALDLCEAMNRKYAFDLPPGYFFTLPTEAQWEYACRAGSTTSLYNNLELTTENGFCPNLDKIAWYNSNIKYKEAHRSGLKQPNNWGIYDMLGNLWEWCYDEPHPDPDKLPKEKELVDPIASNGRSVIRGGSIYDDAHSCRCASRYPESDYIVARHIGFRIALAPVHYSSYKP